MKQQTLGLYVQVPFCASKCSFCNFSSQVRPDSEYDAYCAALQAEVRLLPEHLLSAGVEPGLITLPVDSVYFGGGTPSLLGSQRLRGAVNGLKSIFSLARFPEFTVEITPGSADVRLLEQLAESGVNRLSIGAQSFDDRELRVVGRLHSAQGTVEQVRQARQAGIEQISLDLIAGLPYQTEGSWLAGVDRALALAPEHLSIYIFEADDKSRLGRELHQSGNRYHAGSVPDEEFMAWAYEEARRRLSESGYRQYEISNFARPGFESKHNLKYWNLDPYLGLGAGAHSFDGRRRWSNVEEVGEYRSRLASGKSPISEFRVLDEVQQVEEFFFLGLRRRAGVDLNEAIARWSEPRIAPWQAKIDSLIESGWLERTDGRIRLADRALLVSNEIFQEFVAA